MPAFGGRVSACAVDVCRGLGSYLYMACVCLGCGLGLCGNGDVRRKGDAIAFGTHAEGSFEVVWDWSVEVGEGGLVASPELVERCRSMTGFRHADKGGIQ